MITTHAPSTSAPGPVGAAVALRAALSEVTSLPAAELGLFTEWLDLIVTHAHDRPRANDSRGRTSCQG